MLRLLLILGLFSVTTAAFAKTKYRIGVEDINYLPYYNTQNQQYLGFSRELFDLFAAEENIDIEYVPLPLKRLSRKFNLPDSNLDFKYPDGKHWHPSSKKGHQVYYSDTIVTQIDGVMMHKSWLATPAKKIRTLGMVQGFVAPEYLSEIRAQKLNVTFNNDIPSLLNQLLAHRVDAAYMNIQVAKYLLQNNLKKSEDVFFNDKMPHTINSFSLSSIKHPQVISVFNNFLKTHAQAISELKKKHGI